MESLNLRPAHAPVKKYFEALAAFEKLGVTHETAVRSAFQDLLSHCARQKQWTLVPEYAIPRKNAPPLRADGMLLDAFKQRKGLWEAKDEDDDLEREAKKKIALGYPKDNLLMQSPEQAILYRHGAILLKEDITSPDTLVDVVKEFFSYSEPVHDEWEAAVLEFKDRIPEIALGAKELIERERQQNKRFVAAFDDFFALCRQAINPSLTEEAVEKMLIQHLLTERIFRHVFENPEFTLRNVIAAEIEKVIDSLTSRHFSRDQFLKSLDRFYVVLERAAKSKTDYTEKQDFLNTVYERFFQGFDKKAADTHGIVYTPQPIVDFMVRSVEEILKKEFGRSLSDEGVHILDPFVGTGNFITRVMREIKPSALKRKYESELHCNEVMLLPYYIASMNIEHEYMERTGEYSPFDGICLVDTFELAEPKQTSLFSEENAERVERQKKAPITVIVGNPPYSVGQDEENDNNKNRKYPHLDQRIAQTYAKASEATNKNALSDAYIRAFRWASDRLDSSGVVAFVTNSGYIETLSGDGVRRHLTQEFEKLYILDLGGGVRRNPKLSGTTHNVFGIQAGVSIALLVRDRSRRKDALSVLYNSTPEYARKEEKLQYLANTGSVANVSWTELTPDGQSTWLRPDHADEFSSYACISELFESHTNGVKTNRDTWMFSFGRESLRCNVQTCIDFFNEELERWLHTGRPSDLDSFVRNDDQKISWSRDLKLDLKRGKALRYVESRITDALYRPFTHKFVYFDPVLNEEVYTLRNFYKDSTANRTIICTSHQQIPFSAQCTESISCLDVGGRPSKCFPAFISDGTNRRENITNRALEQFRSHYADPSITKRDIFHYTYAVLHHPAYRERYAANLKRELPRIPFAPKISWTALVAAGRRLADIHVHYEQQPEYKLEHVEKDPFSWRVEKMKLSKDKTVLFYNDSLTLKGIPPQVFGYRLGNRSALEWVIDQYQVSTDKRSGIVNDPNRADDPEYILRLIKQVITVSLETVQIVNALPDLGLPQQAKAAAQI